MKPTAILTLAFASLMPGTMAGPIASDKTSVVSLILSEQVEGGNLSFYGTPDRAPLQVRSDLQARVACGDNLSNCDKVNEAWINTCDNLFENLKNRKAEIADANADNICLELGSNNRCCVAWANKRNFPLGDLLNAWPSFTTCNSAFHPNLVSARSTWVKLGGLCNTQCLSNRAGYCDN